MSDGNIISFDAEKLVALKHAYQAAVEADSELFEFEGNEYVVDYARYLIEYLETQLGAS